VRKGGEKVGMEADEGGQGRGGRRVVQFVFAEGRKRRKEEEHEGRIGGWISGNFRNGRRETHVHKYRNSPEFVSVDIQERKSYKRNPRHLCT
jgi:hypothetical protein